MPASSALGGSTSAIAPKKSLFEDESSSDDDQEEGGATLDGPSLKINEEYARRFEHNKKREELQRLEEKYKSSKRSKVADDESGSQSDFSESSSEGESEDEDAILATEDLDAEISATLRAIKEKNPIIYDKGAVFYKPFDAEAPTPKEKKEKPVTLREYHRQRYLAGDTGADDEEESAPRKKTYVEEQEDLKKSVVSEIKAEMGEEEEWSDDDAFLKPKDTRDKDLPAENGIHPSRAAALKITDLDISNAEKNPDEYLSKFMASRAWAPEEGSKWAAFESDDDDGEDDRAEDFEFGYNLRFEDPEKSNELLKSYSRNVVAERSVRKEELTGRQKKRALEKEQKEAEKKERQEERARLRRLKIEEASEKLALVKKAAGIGGKELKEDEWVKFLDDAWDNDKWEAEMNKQFGEEYYAQEDALSEDEDDEAGDSKKKPKKPKWDDDIDITDLIPDFDEGRPNITLSDSEPEADEEGGFEEEEEEDDDDERPAKKRKTSKDHKKDKINAKRDARKERARIEALVDSKMELDDPTVMSKSKTKTEMPAFRYRETSPQAFGMTAQDILLAPSDAALNDFAGLKKLATFRDADKKKKDKKRLGKKARLREWRRETFGREFERTGPTFGFEQLLGQDAPAQEQGSAEKEGEKKRKRKRSKGKGAKGVQAGDADEE
ncbi:Krr1-domain-containing protein [Thozetella sp. PMI_491]|nr:Krr1-domain-containing protein [Thozetella sp. PMI_491]